MTEDLKINTDRLFLRPINLDNVEEIFKYRSDAVSNKYQSWIPETTNDVSDFINDRVSAIIDLFDTWYQFVIIKKDDLKLIGDIGIHFLDKNEKQVEIGITLDKNFQGKGYATEALKQVIKYLFTDLKKHRITVSLDPRNVKSMNLIERLGFRKEAHFKESILSDGKWVDDLVYALLKDEWIKKN